MSYLTYGNYINTPVEYIDKIPNSWKLTRNKNLFIKNKQIAGQIWTKYPVLSLTKEDVKIKDIKKNEAKMPSDFGTYQIIEPGNLLLCLFDIDVTPRCVGYIENKGIVSGAYSHIIPITDLNMKYYYYWYLMLDNTKELVHLSKNLRNSLSNENFMELHLVQPPLKEQNQIVNFLDYKTSQIEEIIDKNKKLMELLKEKRTSIINQVVTKGLNPNTPMKESGIEWIGKIPKHWQINKIKNLFQFTKGLNITKKDLTENGIPVISYGQIHAKFNDGVHINNELIRYTDKSNAKINSKVSKGDFIFADTSEDIEGCGNSIYINKDMLLYGGYHDVILKSRNKKDNTYLAYLFQSETWRKQLRSKVSGVKVYSINQSILKECYVLIPPNEEQKLIVDYLDKTSINIDKTVEKIEKNIELLEEYKESLIHHVVTGKIDVRGVEV